MNKGLPLDISMWDESCMKCFIQDNSALFYAFASRYVDNPELIDDFLQEAYVKLWTHRKTIGKVQSVQKYFFTILRNTIIDKWAYFASGEKERSLDDYMEVSSNESFIEHIIEAESSHLIAVAIRRLSPQNRRIILLSMDGKTMPEIAEQLHISVNTVKTLKYRALKQLSSYLSKDDFLLFLLLFYSFPC
ncbi:MAG TPA: sigma-70 family RNA polymerase sigma factor [Candidatus Phocaeicola caecigallinarum]|nr:sigma-70 family RNA polymerase sigma factor [Candidatus Phocaeicola caecigallinarum]